MSGDSSDMTATVLTPSHFLVGDKPLALPVCRELSDDDDYIHVLDSTDKIIHTWKRLSTLDKYWKIRHQKCMCCVSELL